jgi:beta-mannosidase
MPKWILATILIAHCGAVIAPAASPVQPVRSIVIKLKDSNWKLGSFGPGDGEVKQAFASGFNDSSFRTVTVPGEVQLQLGLTGMDLYNPSKELTLVNDREWWYRLRFHTPKEAAGKLVRLAFDGVDYFATVWLNGKKLGEHEGAYSGFAFDAGQSLRPDAENLLAVKVTSPWLPEGRAVVEYLKGSFNLISGPGLPKLPYSMGGHWDGVPAGGNAVFPMGITRDVSLLISEPVILENLTVHTKTLHEDGSATLAISGNVANYRSSEGNVTLSFGICPKNFTGESLRLPELTVSVRAGSNSFSFDATVKYAHLWWTWDTGPQHLYAIEATLSAGAGGRGDARQATFGIRTISRGSDLSYRLNGKRIFVKGAWYPMGDYFASVPTRATYETDLRLLRSTNSNHLVNHTVVEKPEFYDLCDELGILLFVQLPFSQDGPHEVLEAGNPRREPFTRAALAQVRDIVTALRNHPSIVQWSPFAEARESGRWSGPQEGYQTFVDEIGKIVASLSPDTLFHPSLCDLGEKHFWSASNHNEALGSYQQLFDAEAPLISEYGAMSMPAYETLKEMLRPEDLWSKANAALPQWFRLPINISAYAYLTSYEYNGLFGVLHRANQFVDRDIRTVRELIDASQLYQGFVYKYATEAFRRKKYQPVNGTRIWDFIEVHPGISFNFLDYRRVPKLGFYYYGQTQRSLALSFAYKPALESQVSGKRLSIPVWVVNDRPVDVQAKVVCEILDIAGNVVWNETWRPTIAPDSSARVGTIDWTTPEKPGIYVLRGNIVQGVKTATTNTAFIKVTPRAFARDLRVLLAGERDTARTIGILLEAAGVSVDTIDETTLERLSLLHDASALRSRYDVVWLTSFDRLWKLLDNRMAEGLLQAIGAGLGFIHTGGTGSFHGGAVHAACLEFTRIADLLPVIVRHGNDLVYPGVEDARTSRWMARLKDIEAPSGRWADPGLREVGIIGFNDVIPRPDASLLMTVSGRPLLVSGVYGKGRTIAYMGFTPVPEDRGESIDPEFLDQGFVQSPALRPHFELFLRMLVEASGQPLTRPANELLALREKPLFQTLKELPAASLKTSESVAVRVRGNTGTLSIELENGSQYARLIRIRIRWEDARTKPELFLLDDNYFDMMPGETRPVTAEVRFIAAPAASRLRGRLIVEASNMPAKEIPIELEVNQ